MTNKEIIEKYKNGKELSYMDRNRFERLCVDCELEMESLNTIVVNDDACGSDCCRDEYRFMQCNKCKKVRII